MDKQQAQHNIFKNIQLVVEGLENIGIPPLKGRDKREPGWREKQQMEDEMQSVMVRYFGKQRRMMRDKLTAYNAVRALPFEAEDIYEAEDLIAELMELLKKATKKGVALFAATTGVQIDWTLIYKKAAEWAAQYTYDLVTMINNTTRKILQYAISQFVETPGMTLRDVMDLLPFTEDRAQTIAVTEITRSYATANQIAGQELKKEFPGVRIVKMWFTNNDDLVCDICAPLDGMIVDIDEGFTTEDDKSLGIDHPPAHVNCRCWTDTTTDIDEQNAG